MKKDLSAKISFKSLWLLKLTSERMECQGSKCQSSWGEIKLRTDIRRLFRTESLQEAVTYLRGRDRFISQRSGPALLQETSDL